MSTIDTQKSYYNVFVARQPIFNRKMKIWGYELFYRQEEGSDSATYIDEFKATMEVMSSLALSPDDKFTAAKVIINFSKQAIIEDLPLSQHPKTTIVQFADPEKISPEFIDKVRKLKDRGYTISIDDYAARYENTELYDLTDIMTLNISEISRADIAQRIQLFPGLKGSYLAKKVETAEQFESVETLGFAYYQGYFFKRPKTEVTRKISSNEMLRFNLMEMLNNDNIDLVELSKTIEKDVSLSARLLNLLNSAAYGLSAKISSVQQAVIYLGWDQLKHWLRMILFTDMKQPGKSAELTSLSLQRAKILEMLSACSETKKSDERLFLVGLFSLLDAMLEMPMDSVVERLSALDETIRETLRGGETCFEPWLTLIEAMEESDWGKVGAMAASLDLEAADIMRCYREALEWSNTVLNSM
ncbi:EAL and HDOD domain-containing protein [Desulfovibrio gilichinskyi]|uniref:EAL and modified HD-GYP domain-containing signal transduction protein n=1 Tax=Desulfovibrio gilichinskyi TaxID=1519643 RepID=A0A1X7DEP5_9BACT|nr:HDOD domain-containing protein [Desulfovibrio gilichinskyi]SMF14121.1 EAL and modified HD-GYP domain-containing signal transduction protein [Desulfovibrio gilichinskyi]